MKDNILPEEKLLRLIRGQKKQQISVQEKQSNTGSRRPKPELKTPAFSYVRKIIPIAFAASCIYFIISFVYPWVALNKIKLPEVKKEETQDIVGEPDLGIKPIDFYLERTKGRSVFGSVSLPESEKPTSLVNDLSKDLILVGIISGENPQAIIEDKKAQKTYYLIKGQFIGEFQVEDIKEGKVILNYQGQRSELHL